MAGLLSGSRPPGAQGGDMAGWQPPMAMPQGGGGMGAAGEGEEGMAPNVSPEEQAAYEKFVDNGLKIIFDKRTAPSLLKRLQASGNPVEGLASTTVQVVSALEESAAKAGQKLDPAILLHGGAEIMQNIAELSKAAGVHDFSDEEVENASYAAMDQYGTKLKERGGYDENLLKQETMAIVEADRAGKIEDLLPGVTAKAQEMASRQKPAQGGGAQKGGAPMPAADKKRGR